MATHSMAHRNDKRIALLCLLLLHVEVTAIMTMWILVTMLPAVMGLVSSGLTDTTAFIIAISVGGGGGDNRQDPQSTNDSNGTMQYIRNNGWADRSENS